MRKKLMDPRWRVTLATAAVALLVASCSDHTRTAVEPGVAPTVPLFSQTQPFNDLQPSPSCMLDDAATWPQFTSGGLGTNVEATNNCTTNDVRLANAVVSQVETFPGSGVFVNFDPQNPPQCSVGQTITLKVKADLAQGSASARHDFGVWIRKDLPTSSQLAAGVGARTGQCYHYNLPVNPLVAPIINNDDVPDSCGGLDQAASTQIDLDIITVPCLPNANNNLIINSCIGWKVPGDEGAFPQGQCPAYTTTGSGQNKVHTLISGNNGADGFRAGTLPGNGSKCNCEGFTVPIIVNFSAKLEVKKACTPTGDGGKFDLKIDGVVEADDASCGGTTGAGGKTVSAGNSSSQGAVHTFAEAAGTGTNLTDYGTAAYECHNRSGGTNGDRGTGTGAGPHNITLQPNDDVICTFTNVRKPTLTIVKRVQNDNNGAGVVGDFGITTDAGSLTFDAGAADGANITKYTSNTITLAAAGGTFTLHESDLAAYTEGTWACTGVAGTVNSNPQTGSVVIASGENAVCTITNNDLGGSLTLVKKIINDNGGAKVVGDFGISTDAPGTLTFDAGVPDPAGSTTTKKYTSNALAVNAGTYSLHEENVTGYSEGSWSCVGAAGAVNSNFSTGSVVIAGGETVTCTITNDDQAGSLQLIKRVVNANGGNKAANDFGINTTAGALTFGSGSNDGANTLKYTSNALPVSAGSYTLRENDVTGYSEGTWSCTGATPSPTSITAGAVTVPNGVDVVCTITNSDQAGSLQLIKRVVNDNGGNKAANDFGINTTAGALTFGSGSNDGANTLKYTSNALPVSAGSYTLRENDIAGYTEGTWTCTGATPSPTSITAGAVTVPNGVDVVCTITNDDLAPSLTITKAPDPPVGNDPPPAGYVVAPGGTARFTITVSNASTAGYANNVVITDDLPAGLGDWADNPNLTECTITPLSGETEKRHLDCQVGTLAPGGSFSVTVEATVPLNFLLQSGGTGTPLEIDGNLIKDAATATPNDWATVGIVCPPSTTPPVKGCALDLPTGNGDDSFGNGTKEDTPVPSVVDGSIPNNKSDLTRFYVANERLNNFDYLYLAWERVQEPTGTTNMDFELNQSSVLSSNGKTYVRTANDILVTYDLSQGGVNPVLGFSRWLTSGPTSDCEASNKLPCWSKKTSITNVGDVAGAINTTIVSDPIAPNAPRSLSVRTFGEARINLQATGIFQPGVCISLAKAYLKSRSSDSFTAAVKDFIAPAPISVSNCQPVTLNNTATVSGSNFTSLNDTGQIRVQNP